MESLLKKEKKTCLNLDLVERKMLELEDNASTLSDIFQHNKRSLSSLTNELVDLTNLVNQISSISIKSRNFKKYSKIAYLSEKIF